MIGDYSLVVRALERIEKKLDSGIGTTAVPENILYAEELLRSNDFSHSFIRKISETLMREVSYENLLSRGYVLKRIRDLILDNINIYDITEPYVPEITVLLGPTGVGKTTTVAKLAAENIKKGRRTGIITTDYFKAGAAEQIETLAKIMKIPYVSIRNSEDMERQIDEWSSAMDSILVDSVGKSPRDEMLSSGDVMAGCGKAAHRFLVVSASTKGSDLVRIMKQFDVFGYDSVICTKLDETYHIGNLISALAEADRSIAYITTGQKIHVNIEKASKERLLGYLEGFAAV